MTPGIGGDYLTDLVVHAGSWRAITALAAATADLVAPDLGGELAGVPIPVGTTIYGNFTSITLTAGKVLAYKA